MAKTHVFTLKIAAVTALLTFIGANAMAKAKMTVPKPMDEQTSLYRAKLTDLLKSTEISCLYASGSGRSLRNRVTSVPRMVPSSAKEIQRILLRQPDANWSLLTNPDGDIVMSSHYNYTAGWAVSPTSYEEVVVTDQETYVISADGSSLKSFDSSSSRTERAQSNAKDKKEFYRTDTVQCPALRAAKTVAPKKLKVAAPAKHACDFSQFENYKDSDTWRALTAAKLWAKIRQRDADIGTGAIKASHDPAFLDSERGQLLGLSFDMAYDDSPANLFSECLNETGKDPGMHAAMFGSLKIAKDQDAGGFIVGIVDPASASTITFVTPKSVYLTNRARGSLSVQNERTLKFEAVDPRARRGLDRRLREFIAKYPALTK